MWITGRTKEMALYKAVGAKNTSIFILLFKEIIEFSLISMIIAFALQYGVNYFVNNNNLINSYLTIDYTNFIKCSAVITIMSLISIIPAYLLTTHIRPVSILKEE